MGRYKPVPAGERKRRESATAADRMSAETRALVAERLERRMAEAGLSKRQVARDAKVGWPLMLRILAGEEDNPKFATLSALARAVKLDLAALILPAHHVAPDAATIPVIGTAEVGIFKSGAPQQSGVIADERPQDERYAANERRGIVVTDGSLEEMVYAPGAVRVVGRYIVASPDMAIEDGAVYLVHHANSYGDIETAFRRAAVMPDRYEFAPLFRDAARNERYRLTVIRPAGAETIAAAAKAFASARVEIGGLFYGATCQYR